MAILARLERRDLRPGHACQGRFLRLSAARGEDEQGLAAFEGEARRLIAVGLRLVRINEVAEHSLAVLLGAVVGVPVIVHGPGVEGRGWLDLVLPGAGVRKRADEVRGEAADFHQRRVGREPGDTIILVGDVHVALDGEPVLAGAENLVGLRPYHAPGHVHAHYAIRHVEGEAEMNPFLGAHRLLVHGVNDLDVVTQRVEAIFAGEFVAGGRVRLDEE